MKKTALYRGFTLLELLIVIAILSLLASLVVIQLRGPQKTAKDVKRQSELKQYQTALEVYASRHNDRYPSGSGNMTSQCTELGLSTCPNDPISSQPYRYTAVGGGSGYVIWATLEKKSDAGLTQYFVLCSTGEAGITTTVPGSNCPI